MGDTGVVREGAVVNHARAQRKRRSLGRVLSVVWQGQTYKNLLYLLLAFPLGVVYVCLLAVVAFGVIAHRILGAALTTAGFVLTGVVWAITFLWVSTFIVLVRFRVARATRDFLNGGMSRLRWLNRVLDAVADRTPRMRTELATIPLEAAWRLGVLERALAIRLLGVNIAPMAPPVRAVPGSPSRLRRYLASDLTWTSMAYLLAKLPLGGFGFLMAAASMALTLWLLFMPLITLSEPDVSTSAVSILGALAVALSGLLVGLVSLHLVNGLAYVSGAFARQMLGTSDTAQRLVETQSFAEHQRAKAERAEQSRRELIVNVSHELRTPVASIRGHVESLMLAVDGSQGGAPADLENYLGIVHRETERLNALVDELLSLARAEADELHMRMEPVPADEVIEEVYTTLAPLARRERQVSLVRVVPGELPPVQADRQRLEQVLLNLVRNAITHTPEGGIVSLGLERCGEAHLALTVADTGSGIPSEELELVFQRFYRKDESRTRASGGFGLGLAIVRELVSAMGGSVTVQSRVGEGSCFRVLLRTAPRPAAATTQCGMDHA